MPKEHITPMESMLKGFDALLNDAEGKTGQVLEVSIDKLYFRQTLDYVDETEKWLVESSSDYFAKAFGQTA
jgi:hypothetical protein